MKNYRKEKKTNKLMKLLRQLILIFLVSTMSIVLYDIYINIDVEEEYETSKLTKEINAESTDDISEMLENASKSVVRNF